MYEICRVAKSIETESRLMITGGGGEDWRVTVNSYRVSYEAD